MKTFKNFIGGEWVPADRRRVFRESAIRPTCRDVIGRFPLSGADDVDARRRVGASAGSRSGARTPAPARGDVLRRVGDLMVERKEEIADLMTREMGKPLAETRGDVQEGIDTAYLRRDRRATPVRPHGAERAARTSGR